MKILRDKTLKSNLTKNPLKRPSHKMSSLKERGKNYEEELKI